MSEIDAAIREFWRLVGNLKHPAALTWDERAALFQIILKRLREAPSDE